VTTLQQHIVLMLLSAKKTQWHSSPPARLDKIERLLVEKKQTEAEMGLKARYLRCQWQVASCGNLLPGCKSCQEEREEVMKLAKCHPSVSHSEGTNVLVHAVSNKGGAGWQMGSSPNDKVVQCSDNWKTL